jgi:hypothetical protein
MSIRDAALLHNVPWNMLHRYVSKRKATENPSYDFLHVRCQISLLAHEERVIAQNLAVMADWGCPLTKLDTQMAVWDLLNKRGRYVIRFKNNMPGIDWAIILLLGTGTYSLGNLEERPHKNILKIRGSWSLILC